MSRRELASTAESSSKGDQGKEGCSEEVVPLAKLPPLERQVIGAQLKVCLQVIAHAI